MKIAIVTAAVLLSLSSFAYADSNSSSVGGDKAGKDATTTGSVKSGTDSPDQDLKDKCLAGTASKEECAGLPQQ